MSTFEAQTPEPEADAATARRRTGPFTIGDRVQLTDTKGRHHTIILRADGEFHTHRGVLRHAQLIGQDEGCIAETDAGIPFSAFRPLLSDYVLSMPRGAAVVYPKDAAQIVGLADVFPGARVVEAGVGSGALSMSLLRAIGEQGRLLSVERRQDFAEIAVGNVENFFGAAHPAWQVEVGEFADVVPDVVEAGSADRVVLDMLAPWENVAASAEALISGGVFIAYVATTTQLSRVAEELRSDGRFTEPTAWESLVRGWHLDGLAVRPEHRMVGHTGFLISARRMADGHEALERRRRPAKGAHDPEGLAWSPQDLGERPISEKKIRRTLREIKRTSAGADAEGKQE